MMARGRTGTLLAALGLAVSILSPVLTGCASTEDLEVKRLQAQSAYEQAIKNLSDKRVGLGLASLREAILLDPDNPTYRNALGVVHLELGKAPEAQVELAKAVQLDPNYAEAYHNLGLSYAEQGKFEEAIVSYRKALSFPTYPTPEVAYHNIGNAYFFQGKLKEAQEAFRAAIQLEPKLAPAYYGLGLVLSKEGRQEDAKAAFRAARDLDPSSPFGRAAVEALKTLGEGG
jgi:tetratricopeptide (TPR) repeat protein